MKSENHETCRDVMISYVEDVIKIWEGLVHVITYDAYKPGYLHMGGHAEPLVLSNQEMSEDSS